jgi:E3 ubiquitin-protein ligase MYCBP2
VEPDSLCPACYTEPYEAAPCIRLEGCGHVFHADCIRRMLAAGWSGPRITFGFMGCPLCKARIAHPSLRDLLEPLAKLEATVRSKALLRLSYENADKAPELSDPLSAFYKDPAGYAMHRFAYYRCSKCEAPYYGGEARCGAAGGDAAFDPKDLVCSSCLPHAAEAECAKHGREFIVWKCRFCCSEALFFCFGTTHFCSTCHDRPGECQEMERSSRLPKCPAGPLGKALPGGVRECPLKGAHPDPGTEFVLGCSICRNASTF